MILDVVTNDPKWVGWSGFMLSRLVQAVVLVINPIIYAEVSVGFERIEELDDVLSEDLFRRDPLPWDAGFLAGKCFLTYRRRGGQRRSPMPDFYIGAHAAVAGLPLLTRDPKRYRSYFPDLSLLSPLKEEEPLPAP